MRLLTVVFVLLTLPPVVWADDKENKPVTPADAAKMVDKKVTVEMEVKSTGKSSGVFFLNSEEDFKSEKNFTIFISKEGTTKFKEAKVDDPTAQFKGKTVRVTGTVKLYKDKPEIVVDDPKQIETVDKKKD
jgi:DNA/RNA endonuclease YhcR with UshA esterase domain